MAIMIGATGTNGCHTDYVYLQPIKEIKFLDDWKDEYNVTYGDSLYPIWRIKYLILTEYYRLPYFQIEYIYSMTILFLHREQHQQFGKRFSSGSRNQPRDIWGAHGKGSGSCWISRFHVLSRISDHSKEGEIHRIVLSYYFNLNLRIECQST